jgi:hypothetical protein
MLGKMRKAVQRLQVRCLLQELRVVPRNVLIIIKRRNRLMQRRLQLLQVRLSMKKKDNQQHVSVTATPNIPIHRTSGKLRLPASGDLQR